RACHILARAGAATNSCISTSSSRACSRRSRRRSTRSCMPHRGSPSRRRTTAACSTGSKTPSSDTEPIRWLEVAVPAHREAVEAVSEILGRVGYNGVAVEEPLDAAAPAVVKAYLVYDKIARIRVRRVRDALGHLQAFGLGPIGELTVREVDEE